MRGTSIPVDRFGWLRTRRARVATLVIVAEIAAVGTYLAVMEPAIRNVRYLLYPFVWINLGLAATARMQVAAASRRVRLAAAGLGVGYFLVLALLSGLIGVELGHAHSHSHVTGLQVTLAAPGWGPRVAYAGSVFTLNFVPYRVIGYLSLAFLVYGTVLNAGRQALSGLVGVASCVGCSLPLVESFAVGVAGWSGALAAAEPYSVDLSTLGFVVAVGLLSAYGARNR